MRFIPFFKPETTPGQTTSPDNGSPASRLWLIDLLKLLAANVIVFHHLSAYGPLSEALAIHWPQLISWLFNEGRMAVQVFLVTGGYLAARGVSGWFNKKMPFAVQAMAQRYGRLVLPYMVALILAMVGSAMARLWMSDPAIPAEPSWAQVVSHALLLQNILGDSALSAGVWYIAIDFQLFCVMVLVVSLAQTLARWVGFSLQASLRLTQMLVVGLMAASLFYFNRDSAWDMWALYFLGSYGLGAAVFWAAGSRRPWLAMTLLALVVLVALWVEYRPRIALALCVALLLGSGQILRSSRAFSAGWLQALVRWSSASYALFLVHFPICLLGNVVFDQMGWDGAEVSLLVSILTWAASWVVALIFHRRVEQPLSAWASGGWAMNQAAHGLVDWARSSAGWLRLCWQRLSA
jgi:peptidoglycan/LPS O-acetylase OafA/YrhL